MTDRLNRSAGTSIIGSVSWCAAIAFVCCAPAGRAQASEKGRILPAPVDATVRRTVRMVPIVEGRDLQFRRVRADGLSHTRVAQIVQDDRGFMWFGSARGLYRYDGYELRVFRHDARQTNTLSGVYVHSLARGGGSTLWIGSDAFLDRYDTRTEIFTPNDVVPDAERPGSINVYCMTEDVSGTLWLCTRSGLRRFDPQTRRTVVLRHRDGDSTSLSDDAIQFVGEGTRGTLWVGTNAGFDLLDRASLQVVRHLPVSRSPTGMSVHEDRSGLVWIVHGSEGELAVFDRSTNTLATWRPSSPELDADPVMFSAILEDREGTMWFGTLNHGVLKYDRDRDRFIRYTSDPSNPHSISDRRVNVLYQDREGLIWAGLHQSEPNYFLPRPPSFQSLALAGRQSTLISGITEDHAGLVWVGLDRGVRALDRATGRYHDVRALSSREPTSIVESAPGVLWIGTAGHGLWRYDQRTGEVRGFRSDPRRATSLPSDNVEQVRLDTHGSVWAVTWRGLARWDPDSEQFSTLMPAGAPADLTLHTATFAKNGVIWIGSNFGLYRIDPAAGTTRWFRHVRDDESSLSNDRVNSIHESSDGSIWIGTQVGLDHWDSNAIPIRRYTQENGLPGIVVSCLLEDESRRLWMSTDRGIARLTPSTGEFRAYGTADGLTGVNMTGWDGCARAASGEMFFAGFAGAVAFQSRMIVERGVAPPIVLTRLRLLSSAFGDSGARTVAPVPSDGSEIRLRPSQGKFSIEFAALSFLSPETNRFRYRLHGLHEEWTEVRSDQRIATYMAIPSGAYQFQVQGATGDGPWNSTAATLRLVMLPPWWATPPSYALAALIVAATLVFAYRLRVRQLTRAANVRYEERWAERTRIARELHDTLLQGFQGLMFRLQAVRDLLPDNAAKAIPVLDIALGKGADAIDDARSAVSDLRSWEKVDRDFEAGLAALAESVVQLPREGRVPSCEVTTRGRVREIPPMVLYELYRMAQEAMSNAFRHSRAEHVAVDVTYGAEHLRVTVTDDGIGVEKNLLSSEGAPGHFGMRGMGERIARLGGKIALRSRPHEGTRVMLLLPASVAYLEASATGNSGTRSRWRARSRITGRD